MAAASSARRLSLGKVKGKNTPMGTNISTFPHQHRLDPTAQRQLTGKPPEEGGDEVIVQREQRPDENPAVIAVQQGKPDRRPQVGWRQDEVDQPCHIAYEQEPGKLRTPWGGTSPPAYVSIPEYCVRHANQGRDRHDLKNSPSMEPDSST